MVDLFAGLRAHLPKHCTPFNADLVERILAAAPLEIQINTRTDIGTLLDPDNPTARYHDGIEYRPLRWPFNSAGIPDWSPRKLTYPLDFAADIGTTGHSPNGSIFGGFDIDSAIGHAVGISADRVAEIDRMLRAIDYVENRRSTRGIGRHGRFRFSGFDTNSHSEHAGLNRAALALLCKDLGINLAHDIDTVGGNLWFWSNRATEANRGFELLQAATRILTPADLPNWRDHVPAKKLTTVRIGWEEKPELDEEHKRVLRDYPKDYSLIDRGDHYDGHTAAFKQIQSSYFYETASTANNPGEPNCAIYVRPNGVFQIVRYGTPTEHPTWDKTANGHPTFQFNAPLSPKTACRAADGAWTGNAFTCETVAQAKEAARYLNIQLPDISDRAINFTLKHGGVTVECERSGKETVKGWGIGTSRKLKRHFDLAEREDGAPDDEVRHLVNTNDEDSGFLVNRDDHTWGRETKDGCKDVLHSRGFDDPQEMIGRAIRQPWQLVNLPFERRYLSGRRANLYAAQLIPTGDANKPTKHFDSIRDHCGQYLTPYILQDEWCKQNNIRTGGDFLRLWDAKLIQDPRHPLPFIFLWSDEQDTGKSAWPRSLSMLFDRGAVDIHSALEERFNGQLAGAVLGYVEEKSITHAGYLKLKSWIDAPFISIREMRCNSYMLENYLHCCQTANELRACKIEKNDKRTVVIRVSPLDEIIPWREKLVPLLKAEAPDYLAKLKAMRLPPAFGRCFLPIIDTGDKEELTRDEPMNEKRVEIVKKMVNAVVPLGDWEGFGGEFLKAIGPGPWSNAPGTAVVYLNDAIDLLRDRGVLVTIASTRVKGQRLITVSTLAQAA